MRFIEGDDQEVEEHPEPSLEDVAAPTAESQPAELALEVFVTTKAKADPQCDLQGYRIPKGAFKIPIETHGDIGVWVQGGLVLQF